FEVGHRTDVVAHRGDEFVGKSVGGGAVLEYDETAGHLTADLVVDADHRGLGHGRVRGQHRLDRPGRKPVSSNVDHIVDAAHHEQVAVVVDVSAVAGEVVAGIFDEVAGLIAGVVVPQR